MRCLFSSENSALSSTSPEGTLPAAQKKYIIAHRPLLYSFLFLTLSILVMIGGFIYFVIHVHNLKPPSPLPIADAIIVLTGGENRMQSGLKLLENKRGKRLLISGVNPATNRKALIRVTGADKKLFQCCVDIGHEALNTIGNAQESATWIAFHHYHNVYIVTNNYHMPRSLREMQRFMPHIQFIPYPIYDHNGLKKSSQIRLLILEYIKTIGAEIRGWFL